VPRALLQWIFVAAAVYVLYFHGLAGVGLLGPDEPRYASIGREMARSGDWITPRLWGEPWFEKPALLYWMIGLGHVAGLGDELGPRLPIAGASVAFLVFYWRRVSREFGERTALVATAMLGTSAGWLAYSHVAVPDLPLAASFNAAVLLLLGWVAGKDERVPAAAGALLGVAVLAKGLVPLVLLLPALWFGRRRLRGLASAGAAFAIVAMPWYATVTSRYGAAFLDEFLWRHHFGRFANAGLQHIQPWWFYLPVLAAGLFPWTPALAAVASRRLFDDVRIRFLAVTAVFGLLFFSVMANKLPGYLLPLIPAVCTVAGQGVARLSQPRWLLAGAAVLLIAVPVIAPVLPRALEDGVSSIRPAWPGLYAAAAVAAVVAVILFLRTEAAVAGMVAAIAVCVVYLGASAYPAMDAAASARGRWLAIRSGPHLYCLESAADRDLRYGLNYYAVEPLPDCGTQPALAPVR
jgi:4-amino-4-deoxy-L-arabinose transferase-like glycosyltransferase